MRRAPNASATGLSVFSLSVLSLKAYGLRVLGLSLLLLALGAGAAAHAQLRPVEVGAEIHAAGGTTGDLPFWLAANRYGTVDPESANLGLRLHAHRPFAGTGRVDYAFGVDLVGRASERSTLHAHQLYGQVRVRPLELNAGRHEQMIGRVDTSLSLGSVTWSRNASPPPKVSVSTAGYVNVPGTQDHVAVKGYFAHGWLGADRFVTNAFLHDKYLYVRLLPPSGPVTLHGGLTHHVMWGGTHPRLGPLPAGFNDFVNVVLGQRNDEESRSTPAFANQIASYDFSAEIRLSGWQALLYRHFYHEDTPSLAFRNPWDGLWGVSLRQQADGALVEGVLWEHLVMTRHNAKYSEGQERGADTYYNHSVYESGWTYQGRTLGLPLLTPAEGRPGIGNNIVVAHHVGLEGTLTPRLSYRLLGTYSRNYGAQKVCADADCSAVRDERTPRRDQYAFLVTLSGTLSAPYGLRYETTLALDTGDLYDTRLGGGVTLSWTGALGR